MNPQDLEQSAAQQHTPQKSVSQKRLIGLAIVVICIAVTFFDWTQETSSSRFDIFIGFLSPFFVCLAFHFSLSERKKIHP
jgi:hypothetical protein